jgi:hypothetical protein
MCLGQQLIPKSAGRLLFLRLQTLPTISQGLVLGQASDPMFNPEHLNRPLIGAQDTPTRFLSMFQPLSIVLFYTSLWVYTAAVPRKLVYEAQRDKEFAVHVCVKHPRTMRPKTE